MNTSDVVTALAENWDMSKAETRRLLDVIVSTFNNNLAEGNAFTIPGLGTFSVRKREQRKSYNPHYERYMQLPPKLVVDFRPNKNLKEDLKKAGFEDE